ncbi:MAG TPA: hypothetical protein PLT00_05230, partial [Verrucomicrobiota bacterium]|nr:hypothetical protein [Verrucomicrobiota bacterium]HQB16101.1 hypothetical protein [Verrucomicrobiota bacterium]
GVSHQGAVPNVRWLIRFHTLKLLESRLEWLEICGVRGAKSARPATALLRAVTPTPDRLGEKYRITLLARFRRASATT